MSAPYFTRGGVSIYLGDCREFAGQIDADLILTDPPYGISKAERTYASPGREAAVWDEAPFVLDWADAFPEVPVLGIMPGVVNLPGLPAALGDRRFRWVFALHVTNGMTRAPVGYGNWIPCALYSRDGVKVYAQASDVARIAVTGRKPAHPSPKPVQAMEWLVNRFPGEHVLDPFMGSGTTLLAAMRAGRRATGIDISEEYCELAARRLEAEPAKLV